MRTMDKNGGLSLNPEQVEFSGEPSLESDSFEIGEHNWLTRREIDVLTWVAEGKTNKEIGVILHVSSRTVSKHLEHIYMKLGVESRIKAVVKFRGIMKEKFSKVAPLWPRPQTFHRKKPLPKQGTR